MTAEPIRPRGSSRRAVLLIGAGAIGGAAVTVGGFGIGGAFAADQPNPARSGFETTTTVPDAAVVRVEALDASGTRLGVSRALTA